MLVNFSVEYFPLNNRSKMLNMWPDTLSFQGSRHSQKLYWRRVVFSRVQGCSVKISIHSWNFGGQEGDFPAYFWHLCRNVDAKHTEICKMLAILGFKLLQNLKMWIFSGMNAALSNIQKKIS